MSITVISRTESATTPDLHMAVRIGASSRLVTKRHQSNDDGETWSELPENPQFTTDVGIRRTRVLNYCHGQILLTCINATNVDVGADNEARGTFTESHLRYRLSFDGGLTWGPDTQLIAEGQSASAPIPGLQLGVNAFQISDVGAAPVESEGAILIPVCVVVEKNGMLYEPYGIGAGFFDIAILRGRLRFGGYSWTSARIVGDVSWSTRGLMDPTLAVLPDGRVLCVMRGTNGGLTDPTFALPARQWYSLSSDGGRTWSQVKPWRFDNGAPFRSPSSMSRLLRHSSGRIIWLGNLLPSGAGEVNAKANDPRWPLVACEVGGDGFPLAASVVILDTLSDEDATKGKLDLSHFWIYEDQRDASMWLTYPRSHDGYKSSAWMTMHLEGL